MRLGRRNRDIQLCQGIGATTGSGEYDEKCDRDTKQKLTAEDVAQLGEYHDNT